MDEYLIAKFLREQGMDDPKQKAHLIRKLTKYDDIKKKFMIWMETGVYDNTLRVEEWTAKDIHELAPSLTGIGVHNLLVDLRDNPEEARQAIAEGFPIL